MLESPPDRYLLSGFHRLPSESLPPPSAKPHPSINDDDDDGFSLLARRALKTGERQRTESKTWRRIMMIREMLGGVQGKKGREERFFPYAV